MKRKALHGRPTITAKREIAPAAADGAPAYPTAASIDSPLRERAQRMAQKLLLAGAAVGLAAAATGCQPPSCQPTRLGEARVHGGAAVDDLARFDFSYAKDEVGIGLGILPHPAPMVAGEMISVMPPPPPSPPPDPSDDH